MRPSPVLRSGSDQPIGKYGHYLNHVSWGNLGSPTQRGIITHKLSPNRQNHFAGAGHDAIFNTWRCFRAQVFYVVPPFIAAYYAMNWAVEGNHYLNSKPGRAESRENEN